MDLFEKCANYTDAKDLKESGFYPYFMPLDDTEGTEVTIGDKRLVMIGSNNYLGLTTHPKVRSAACEATAQFGTSCTGSRFLNGTLAMHWSWSSAWPSTWRRKQRWCLAQATR